MRRASDLLDGLPCALAIAGLYVAGTLAISELRGIETPCGASADCGRVAASAAGHFLGLSTALWGVLAYALLLLLAWGRILVPRRAVTFQRAGYALSGLGVLVSAGLVTYATFGVRAVCPWCLASATIMASLFGVHALRAYRGDERDAGSPYVAAISTMLVLSVATFHARNLAFSLVPYDAVALRRVSIETLLPPGAHRLGARDATTTVVMFGDLTCPACQSAYRRLRRAARPGGAALVFRHFPLPSHPDAIRAAMRAEAAGEVGRFWAFLDHAYTFEVYTDETADDALAELKVDCSGLGSEKGRGRHLRARVLADARLARKLGFQVTPTLLVVREGRVRVAELDGAVAVLGAR